MCPCPLFFLQDKTVNLFRVADVDKDGLLTFSEFYSLYACLTILVIFFGESQSSKRLHVQDVRRALNQAGLEATEDQVAGMFIVGDKEKKLGHRIEEINLEQFVEIYINTRNAVATGHVFLRNWFAAGKTLQAVRKTAEITPSQDFLAGTFAGVALTIVGHPFDTVKVRLQTNRQAKIISAITGIVRKEGALAFFKGMGGPMYTIPLINAIVFGGYAQGKDLLLGNTQRELSLGEYSMAGAYAGLLSCSVACPVELLKTRLQIQTASRLSAMRFQGPFDCARSIQLPHNCDLNPSNSSLVTRMNLSLLCLALCFCFPFSFLEQYNDFLFSYSLLERSHR